MIIIIMPLLRKVLKKNSEMLDKPQTLFTHTQNKYAGILHLVSVADGIRENKVLMNVGGLCDKVGSAGRHGSLI